MTFEDRQRARQRLEADPRLVETVSDREAALDDLFSVAEAASSAARTVRRAVDRGELEVIEAAALAQSAVSSAAPPASSSEAPSAPDRSTPLSTPTDAGAPDAAPPSHPIASDPVPAASPPPARPLHQTVEMEDPPMPINIGMPTAQDLKPRIVVFGVGGAGGNAVGNMIANQLNGCEFVVANTDHQALERSTADRRVQLGAAITQGLGAGSVPEVGRAAAEESTDQILDHLAGCHMAFIAAGMGGGTGTGAAPVIARVAREQGILTVGVVTKPFKFEGTRRMALAEQGIEELQRYVDTLIVIPNQNLFCVANEKTTFADAFKLADDVLAQGVRGITDLMVNPGIINLDFADVRTIMSEMGKAVMGTGEAEGDTRAVRAAEMAISNPLLEDITLEGATGVLINITGGMDMTLLEVDEAANRIREEVDPEANIIFGSALDPELDGLIRVSLIATGMDAEAQTRDRPIAAAPIDAVAAPVADVAPVIAAPVPPAPIPAAPVAAPMAAPVPPAPVAAPVAAPAAVPHVAAPAAAAPAEAEPEFFAMPRPAPVPAAAPAAATAQPAAVAPDPMREAELANAGARRVEPPRKPSLLDRLTGGRKAEAAPAPAPAPARPEATVTMIEADDRPAPPSTSADDDLLEIPAFLRRQAN